MNKKLIVIAGPTGIGKTSYAIDLSLSLGAEIFSADSRQIYKEMSIGTAKPSKEELLKVKHHLVDYVSIFDSYSAGDYEVDAITRLNTYFQKHDIAILCGGTGLYIDAVLYGLDEFPDIDIAIRSELNKQFEDEGLSRLLEELKVVDPLYFNQVDQENPRRIIRALEVFRQSGKPFSSYRLNTPKERTFEVEGHNLTMKREILYDRINRRVDYRVQSGLIDEAKQLWPHAHLKALQTVGYQELFDHFNGITKLKEAIALIKQNSRRYAKRQMTWFRKKVDWKHIPI